MGNGTDNSPYTREDVIRLIKENGGKAEGLDLSGKTFERGIDLRKLDLRGIILKEAKLFFKHTEHGAYLDEAFLQGAHLEGANLERAHLKKTALVGTHLEGANLSFAHLEEAYLQGAHLEGADLASAHLEGAKMWGTHCEGAVLAFACFNGAVLRYAYLERAKLHDAKLSYDTALERVHWGNYILGEEIEAEEEEEGEKEGYVNRERFTYAANAYRILKVWYTEHGEYDIAGRFFYREMEAKRKAKSWKSAPFSKLWSWVIKLLCGYGENYERVVVSALVIIFGLAVVYVYGGLNLPYAIYFSAVSFTALGYGSWVDTPAGWVRALGAAESFIGVFMMALFLVTFIRKMTR